MKRRTFLAAAMGSSRLLTAQPSPPPNVCLIITDDQGYGDLGCHGNPVIKTPALDRLHQQSVRLTNFHVSPTCAPTRSALMTGRFTDATGCWHTIMGRSLLHPDEVTLADCFRATGYRTGMFGKWHLGDNYPCRPEHRGFDVAIRNGGGGVWQTPDYFGNDYFDDTYFHNGKPERFQGFCTDVWFDNAMKFIDESRRSRTPFFCYLATNAPHGPMWAPDRYNAPYRNVEKLKEPGFYGMIANIDDNVARMVRFLRDNGLEDNTILIFMTDNGSSSGWGVFNAGMRGHKGSAYDGGHRVPFFIRWPKGGLMGPRDINTLTAHIDVLPTLVDICGLKKPAGPDVHGVSLRRLLYSQSANWPDRVLVTDSQRLENLVKWRQASVMTQQWRLVNPSPDGNLAKVELYDIQKDPGQNDDVARQRPEVVTKLKAEYDKWWKIASQRADEYVRIVLGNDADNPARLTGHDWHGEGATKIWNQHAIRLGPMANGFWAVRVERAGNYRIELRRWPKEVDLPITAPYHDKNFNREKAPGKAIEAVKARLRIGDVERSTEVKAGDKAAVFNVALQPGPAKLETWFYDNAGNSRGAYYVYVERV